MRMIARCAVRATPIILAMTMVASSIAHADDVLPGSQGTDTSLPATDSQVTVHGRDAFDDLAITVNQTAKLTNQAVSITWTGGVPTLQGPERFAQNYLQIFQCWGDDDGTVPDNPGPPPEQCEQGAVGGKPTALPYGYPSAFAMSRVISRSDWANYSSSVGVLDPRTTNVWLPFRAVNGSVVNIQTDPTFRTDSSGNFWLNPFYNSVTTNEIAGASTGADGRGAELFQVLTGVESSALGCGQKTQQVAGGATVIPKCWIVVVPRGSREEENAGSGFAGNESVGVSTSPLSPAAWKHRIAIPIEFNPVDSPCALGADERRISGSSLALPAVTSWQPALCTGTDLPPYSFATVSDSTARQQLGSTQPGAPGMVVVSRPLPASRSTAANPIVYAPLSASGLVIGFNIERHPPSETTDAMKQLDGVRVAELNLTPRLVAKLLTQSYRQAVSIFQVPDYAWMATNPAHLGVDPDFLRFNPEFDLLEITQGRTFSGLQLPGGNSDAAQQVWEWVLADPEARRWLDGTPDEFGMKVNPVYATTAAANSTGSAFANPLPTSFPKADPYCYQAPAQGVGGSIIPPLLCGTDWLPYQTGYAETAQAARIAYDGARIVPNPFALASADVWKREDPEILGQRAMLALTDTPSAARFGLQTARLSRAGDNGAERTFVAADTPGLTAGVRSMEARDVPEVLEPNPSAVAPGAYPLTTLTYAAITPLKLDAQARSDYADFLAYAAIAGQVAGLEFGQLPRGYAPLPVALQAQTLLDAVIVVALVAPPDPEPTTTTTEPETTTTTTTSTTAVPTTTTTVSTSTSAVPTTVVQQVEPPDESPPIAVPPVSTRSNSPSFASVPPAPAATIPAPVATAAPAPSDVPPPSVEETTTTVPATTAAPTTAVATSTAAPASAITKAINVAKSRFAVPAVGVAALGSALGALEITKRPRRRRAVLPAPALDDVPASTDEGSS